MKKLQEHIDFLEEAIGNLNVKLATTKSQIAKNVIRCSIHCRLAQIEGLKRKMDKAKYRSNVIGGTPLN